MANKLIKEIETFFDMFNVPIQSKPSAFNNMVRIKKYKVLVVEIEESDEIYIQRLKELFKVEQSFRNKQEIDRQARLLGYDLYLNKYIDKNE